MAKIIGVETAFPAHRHSQAEVSALLAQQWPEHTGVIHRLAKTSGVEHRNLVMPLAAYPGLKGMGQRQQVYTEVAMKLLVEALGVLHDRHPFPWEDVGAIFSTTVTGIAVPSMEARLMNRFPLPRDLVRMPLFGLGCLGGVGTLNRAADWLRGHPEKLVLITAVEACSLTFQLDDCSMANLVATHLFGDGAAVVLLAGERHPLATRPGLRILRGMASFYPDTERTMGWDVVDDGFRIVLSGSVPEIVQQHLPGDLARLLPPGGPQIKDVDFVVSHPGGPKVLDAVADVLGGRRELLRHSWDGLRERGNMSSVSVLDVLARTLANPREARGLGLALAMGPAFNAELALLEGA